MVAILAKDFEKYICFNICFPVFVAFLAIFLVWYCMKWHRKYECMTLDEDESLTEEIKAKLNPDALTMSSECQDNLQPVNHERNISEKCHEDLNLEDKETEMRIQEEQLKQIFKLMERDKEKYGISSLDDVKEQMKRYKT